MIGFLEKKAEQSPELDFEQDEKLNLLSTVKLLAYIKSSTMCLIEDQIADNNNNNADNIGKVSCA